MKKVIIISILILLISCGQKHTRQSPSFNFIDISFSDGWTDVISVNIDSSKVIKVRVDKHNGHDIYYKDTLPDTSFNKINNLVKSALKTKHDSVINDPVCDGGGFYLLIAAKQSTINTLVFTSGQTYAPLDSLVSQLFTISKNIKKITADTNFTFISYQRLAPPPPMKEMTKFVPPEIKDDNIKK
ncbi:MAG: hypothetical protein ACK50A_16610 [Sphingobacteriaceae bacterium]|jgi:hypothetical protein